MAEEIKSIQSAKIQWLDQNDADKENYSHDMFVKMVETIADKYTEGNG
jgi:hypothetical protein